MLDCEGKMKTNDKYKSGKMYIYGRPNTAYREPVPMWCFRILYNRSKKRKNLKNAFFFTSKDLREVVKFRNEWLQRWDKERWEKVKNRELNNNPKNWVKVV